MTSVKRAVQAAVPACAAGQCSRTAWGKEKRFCLAANWRLQAIAKAPGRQVE